MIKDFRFEVWTDGRHQMCAFRAEMPESKGLNYLWFVLHRSELQSLSEGRLMTAQDAYHQLSVMGDSWTFFDLELDYSSDSGILPVKFFNLKMPRFFVRALYRYAVKVWGPYPKPKDPVQDPSQDWIKKVLNISSERLARIQKIYGQGTGQVKVNLLDRASEYLNSPEGQDQVLLRQLAHLERIAANQTYMFFQTAKLNLALDRKEDYFYWAVYTSKGAIVMNGALIKHSDGNWGIHT